MKEKQNYTAHCYEQGSIFIDMPGCAFGKINNKETALQLAQSILSAVNKAWADESENEFIMNGKTYIAFDVIEDFHQCEECAFFGIDVDCNKSMECESHKRNDGRNIYWKVKE